MTVEDQLRCGPPSMSKNDKNVEKVYQAVLADCCQANDEISEITDVSWSSCQCILIEDLMMNGLLQNL